MIGSVSTGFRRCRTSNASNPTAAAIASPAGRRQPPPGDRADVRGIAACRSSSVCRPDRSALVACPSMVSPPEVRARCNFTLASGIAGAVSAACPRARRSAGFAAVSGAVRLDLLLVSLALAAAGAAPSTVASGARSAVCEAGLAAVYSTGAAPATGAVTAGSTEAAAPAAAGAGRAGAGTAGTAGSAAGGRGEVRRGGSKVSGST
jgi:hypothetical protein